MTAGTSTKRSDTPGVLGATGQPPLAAADRILDRFADVVGQDGLAGERRAAMLIFLAVVSRLGPRPVSVVVKGPSAGGKSFLVSKVLSYFPSTAYYPVTAMSERALAYSEEPMSHRTLVIYEYAALRSDFGSYLVRSLLSEGRIRYETVEKTKAGLKARLIDRPGPTNLITTTTSTGLHPENETRLLSLTITDSPEQTRAVLLATAEPPSGNPDGTQEWHELQDWLAEQDNRVVVPFARILAEETVPTSIRLRRSFQQLLDLTAASALLHQANRVRDQEGLIVASTDDYATVHDLVAELMADAVDRAVPPTIRETVEVVARLGQSGADVTATAVARELDLDKAAVSRRLKVAIGKGYIRNEEERRGRPMRLSMGDPLPSDQPILPTPERLISCIQGAGVPTGAPSGSEDSSPSGALCVHPGCSHEVEEACGSACETEDQLLDQVDSLRRRGWTTEPGGAYVAE